MFPSRLFPPPLAAAACLAAAVLSSGCFRSATGPNSSQAPPLQVRKAAALSVEVERRREAEIQAAFEAHPGWSPALKDYIRRGYGAQGMTLEQLRLSFYPFEWRLVTSKLGPQGQDVETWEIFSPAPHNRKVLATLYFRNGKLASYTETP